MPGCEAAPGRLIFIHIFFLKKRAKKLYFCSPLCITIGMNNWIEKELSSVNLSDKRLNKRFLQIMETLSGHMSESIPSACCSWAETVGAYRFFNNKKVSPEKLLSPHIERSKERMSSEPVVLCVEDTTYVKHASHLKTKGLGFHSNKKDYGYFAHCMLALTPQSNCLGVLRQHCWVRDKGFGRRHSQDYRKESIDEKESFRWVQGATYVESMSSELPDTKLVYVADRESDVYEVFESCSESDFLIRTTGTRVTPEGKDIKKALEQNPALGSYELKLPTHLKQKRKKKSATLEIRASSFEIRGPYRYKQGRLDDRSVTAILVQEIQCHPEDKPIQWILLSSIECQDFETALQLVQWYSCRWNIEIFFNTLKSGCQIESLQLKSFEKLQTCLSVYMLMAWRVMLLRGCYRSCPQADHKTPTNCEYIFSPIEWKAIWLLRNKSIPNAPAPLCQTILELACLGGYLNRKNDPPPGPKVLWKGLQRVRDAVILIQNKTERCV